MILNSEYHKYFDALESTCTAEMVSGDFKTKVSDVAWHECKHDKNMEYYKAKSIHTELKYYESECTDKMLRMLGML